MRCNYVSPRAKIQCQLPDGHSGDHRAWTDDGIPCLKIKNDDYGKIGQ